MPNELVKRKVEGKLKTITVGGEGEPTLSLCFGHVDALLFNEAFRNEGWTAKQFTNDDLVFEWWKRTNIGEWVPSNKLDNNAFPMTVGEW